MPPQSGSPDLQLLPRAIRFEGHAIVSANGMIANPVGTTPAALRNDADWQQFQTALDGSVLVALGRLGHARHPNPGRRRLVFTSSVAGIAADPDDRLTTLFNPAGATLAQVFSRLGIEAGTVAVTGGTRVFEFFLPFYDGFMLAEANRFALPGGLPCFSGGHPRTALAAAGLHPRDFAILDTNAAVSATRWSRT